MTYNRYIQEDTGVRWNLERWVNCHMHHITYTDMTPNGTTTTVCSLVSSLGSFQWITYKQFDREVQKFRNCLHRLSIGVDDKVSIIRYDSQIEREREREVQYHAMMHHWWSTAVYLISNNRVEWAVAKYAVNSLGAQLVPMYEAQAEKDWWGWCVVADG